MDKFSVVYANEIKKMFKGKSLFVIAVIAVILIALVTMSFEIIMGQSFGFEGDSIEITTPEQGIIVYQEALAQLEQAVANGSYKPTFNENSMRTCKRLIAYYTYLRDNNLTVHEAQPYIGNQDAQLITTGMGYVITVMELALLLATIAVLLFSSSNIMGELKSGALKMQLFRPISRQCLLTAKASASMTAGLVVYGGATLVGIVYSMIRFQKFLLPQVVFFNDNTATLISAGGIFAIQFFAGILSMVFYCTLSYAIGFLSNSKNSALGAPLGIMLLGSFVSLGLGYIYIGYIDPLYNMNFMNTMTYSNTIYAGSNVIVSVLITLMYISIFIAYNYITFKKRDLN